MVDPETGHLTLGDPLAHAPVRRVEHARVFHSEAAQVVDVEKAPVVDLVERRPPVGQPIGLPFEQVVQTIEGCGLSGCAVDAGQRRAIQARTDGDRSASRAKRC